MDNAKNDTYYAKRILKNIEVLSRYLKDKSQDDLLSDGFLCDAIENRFTKLSEDASKLSSTFKESLKTIPWTAIYSIRNRICHDYDVVAPHNAKAALRGRFLLPFSYDRDTGIPIFQGRSEIPRFHFAFDSKRR